jgi:alpha-tubulin suppressor-like RCC1 family protein
MLACRAGIGFVFALTLSGCGGDGGSTSAPVVATVTIEPNATTIAPGETATLVATPRDAAGKALGGIGATWTSASTAIATVASDGTVTAVAEGTTSISVLMGGKTGSASVTVQEPIPVGTVAQIMLDYPAATLARGQELQLNAELRDSSGAVLSARPLSWTSADPGIIQVDATGKTGRLTAGAAGTTTVSVTIDGVSVTSTVTVIAFKSIAAGSRVTCGISTDDKLYCAGGTYGPSAVLESPALRFLTVGATGPHFCALSTSRAAYCWGANESGQLGVGDTHDRGSPTLVSGGIEFSSIAVGQLHTCGLDMNGDAFCWGNGATGQLGTGSGGSLVPAPVQGGLKFTKIAAGSGTTCALDMAGEAYCWGRNDLGQLGTGPTGAGHIGDQRAVPAPVGAPLKGRQLQQIVTWAAKVCALTPAGSAYCWGNNSIGEVGSPTTEQCYGQKPCSTVPLPVSGGAKFTTLAASNFAVCGITTNSESRCWGMDYEHLFGSLPSVVPECPAAGAVNGCTTIPVPGPNGLVTLTGALSNYCGLKSDGFAYCWGGNAGGQRGWGGPTPSSTPHVFSVAPGTSP